MRKAKTEKPTTEPTTVEDMRPEYDFSTMKGGVRGKYYKAYRDGHKAGLPVMPGGVPGTSMISFVALAPGMAASYGLSLDSGKSPFLYASSQYQNGAQRSFRR